MKFSFAYTQHSTRIFNATPQNEKKGNLNSKLASKQSRTNLCGNMLEKINKFIEYWWFRYLLATELYIVEKWERVTMRKC